MPKPTDFRTFEAQQQHYTDLISNQVKDIYERAVAEAVRMATSQNPAIDRTFRLNDYPVTNQFVKGLIAKVEAGVLSGVERGVGGAAVNSMAKIDAFTESQAIPASLLGKLEDYRRKQAVETYQASVVNGQSVTDRMKGYGKQFRGDLETGLAIGIGRGQSAASMAQSLTSYLTDPARMAVDASKVDDTRQSASLQRRVDNDHPGRGMYRSSYKNAERMTRTEINRAYRTADTEQYAALDTVVGYEVRRSGRVSICPVCGPLAGKYPKDFNFVGWHPSCRCFIVPVLVTRSELNSLNELTLQGKDTTDFRSVNEVEVPHEGWQNFVDANRERFKGGAPSFVDENRKYAKPTETGPIDYAKLSESLGFKVKAGGGGAPSFEQFNKNYENVLSGFDLKEFDSEMLKHFDGVGLTIDQKVIRYAGSEIKFSYYAKDLNNVSFSGEDVFEMSRSFMVDDNKLRHARHNFLEMPKYMQDKGLTKDIFKSLYKQYQNAGIDVIDLHANITVGGYAWARYGFSPTTKYELDKIAGLAESKLSGSELKLFDSFYATNKNAKPFPLHSLAEQPYGKKLLMGASYDATLQLSDPIQRSIFENYLYGTEKVPVRKKRP